MVASSVYCGHVENADVNVSFNIALRKICVSQSDADRDMSEDSTDTPQGVTAKTMQASEPLQASAVEVCQREVSDNISYDVGKRSSKLKSFTLLRIERSRKFCPAWLFS